MLDCEFLSRGLTEEELTAGLQELDLRSWEPWEEMLPSEYPSTRQELRRVLEFQSFSEAIRFMAFPGTAIRSYESSSNVGERMGAGRHPAHHLGGWKSHHTG